MSYNSVCFCQCLDNGCIYSDEWRCFIAFQTQLICLKHNNVLRGEIAVTISDCNNPYLIMYIEIRLPNEHVRRKPDFCMYAKINRISYQLMFASPRAFLIQNSKPTYLCGCTVRFVSRFGRNPKDRFFGDLADIPSSPPWHPSSAIRVFIVHFDGS